MSDEASGKLQTGEGDPERRPETTPGGVRISPQPTEPPPPWARHGAPPADPRHELREFWRTLFAVTPRVFVTHLLVGVNVAVLAWMALRGVSLWQPTADQLLACGANFSPATTTGDWWRLATSMFLHVGIVHLLVNMWALWNLGPLLERLVGNVGFALLYLLSGLGGGLASLAFNPHVVSAGASGAIFGLLGGLVGFVLLRRDSVPSRIFWGMLFNGALCIAINVAIGLTVPFIDNAAHVGGLGTGFAAGLLLSRRLDPATARGRWKRNLLLAVLGGTAVAAVAVSQAETNLVDDVLEIREQYRSLTQRHEQGELPAEGFADQLEREILPAWRAARQSLAVRMQAGDFTQDELRELLRLAVAMQFFEDGWEQLAASLRQNDGDRLQRALRTIGRGDTML